MQNAIELKDTYYNEINRHVLVQPQLKIPSLVTFGKQTQKKAIAPLPLHFHHDCFEIVYMSTGSTTFSIGETCYKLSGGDIFITMPDEIHSTNLMPISSCEMYWFQLEVTPNNLLYLNRPAAKDLITKLTQFRIPLIHTNSKDVYPLIKSAFDLCMNDSNPYLAGQYLTLFLYKLIEYQKKDTFMLTPDIGLAINYILDHIKEEFSLYKLAEISHLSISQFKQKFKNQIGFGPRQFINYEKIEYSKELLLDGLSITDIAYMLSFDNSSYFTVVFKRFNMCSPSEFVKQHKLQQNSSNKPINK